MKKSCYILGKSDLALPKALYTLSNQRLTMSVNLSIPHTFMECVNSFTSFVYSSVQSFSRVRLFATPWTVACHASLSITNSRSLLKLMSIESVMPSSHLILYRPFSSHLQSFPASGSFPVSQLFADTVLCTVVV